MIATSRIGRRGRALVALGFALGYGLLRLSWAAGGRWGYTACDRTRSPEPAELADGCGAERLATLPFRGWPGAGYRPRWPSCRPG
ncbi:hypothetical protein AAH979_08430 [Plantactinospora sp. ZYX-F-223]|uniref:hypothetical protein n=1 Tax=Plantactinospora sp. ZYX-F-223 TaxID=3144103 RepID=UPI0031FD611A